MSAFRLTKLCPPSGNVFSAHTPKVGAYGELLRRLLEVNRFAPVKLNLDNTYRLHEATGRPGDSLRVVHVSGSNGKGSVCWKTAQVLRAAGYNVGLFVSPHISTFRERLQVNNKIIGEQRAAELLQEVFDVLERQQFKATFFEITTILALKYFATENTDVVVLETGLGGRLDSTNILIPELSIITSIGKEHTQILGDTIEAIAHQKAGIMKAGVPVVVGPSVPQSVIEQRATELGCPVSWPLGHYAYGPRDYEAENAAIVRGAIDVLKPKFPLLKNLSKEALEGPLASLPPCRFEWVQKVFGPGELPGRKRSSVSVIFDVAHNPPAIASLFRKIKSTVPGQRVRVIAGFSANKDITTMLSIIAEHVPADMVHLVHGAHPRCATLDQLREAVPSGFGLLPFSVLHKNNLYAGERAAAFYGGTLVRTSEGTMKVDGSVKAALQSVIAAAAYTDREEVIVVCGSIFIMREARLALGMNEPCDPEEVWTVEGSHLKQAAAHRSGTNPQSQDGKGPAMKS